MLGLGIGIGVLIVCVLALIIAAGIVLEDGLENSGRGLIWGFVTTFVVLLLVLSCISAQEKMGSSKPATPAEAKP